MTRAEADQARANRRAAEARGLVLVENAAQLVALRAALVVEDMIVAADWRDQESMRLYLLFRWVKSDLPFPFFSSPWAPDWAVAILDNGAAEHHEVLVRWIWDIAHGTALVAKRALDEVAALTFDEDLLTRISAATLWPRTNAPYVTRRESCVRCGKSAEITGEEMGAPWICGACEGHRREPGGATP